MWVLLQGNNFRHNHWFGLLQLNNIVKKFLLDLVVALEPLGLAVVVLDDLFRQTVSRRDVVLNKPVKVLHSVAVLG